MLLLQTLSIRNVKGADTDEGYPLLYKLRNSFDYRDLQVTTSDKPICVGKAYIES